MLKGLIGSFGVIMKMHDGCMGGAWEVHGGCMGEA